MKTEAPSISIIVPVYKVETYLPACLDSILQQGFSDYELLLIDDGSPDRSGEICDLYTMKDSRIQVFHQKNAGPSAARNTGLDNARGSFIAMVDSDDILLRTDYLQILFNAIVQRNAQISLCGHYTYVDGEPLPKKTKKEKEMILNGPEYGLWKNIPRMYMPNCPHGKLYRRELFDCVRFPEGRIFEDIAIQHRLTFPCERIVLTGMQMYAHRFRMDGVEWGTPKEVLIKNHILAFQDRIDYYLNQGCDELAEHAEQVMLRWLNRHK